MPVPSKPLKKKPVAGVPFLDMSTYAEGGQSFDIPEGNYAIQYRVVNAKYTDGTTPIGTEITAFPLGGGDPVVKFITYGKGMEESWMPSGDGMSVLETEQEEDFVRKPFSKKGNWAVHLKSLYDAVPDIPNLSDSFEPIDGIWATIQNIPEPEERSTFGQSTAEETEKRKKFPNKIPVITAILDGGKPWEGGGGFDFEAKPTKTVAKKPAPPAVKPKAKPTPEPEEEAEEEQDENEASDATTVADSAVAAFLAKNKAGSSSAMLQTSVFSAVKKEHGAEMAQAVMGILKGDSYEALLGGHSFELKGVMVKPVK